MVKMSSSARCFLKPAGTDGSACHRRKASEQDPVGSHHASPADRGIEASASERCQHQNQRIARAILESRVAESLAGVARDARNTERRSQVGSGERGDKIRTYRQQDDVASDHRTGRKVRLSDVIKGRIELFGNS